MNRLFTTLFQLFFICLIPIITNANNQDVYFNLLSISDSKIPNINCDISKKHYTVGDFMVEYLLLTTNDEHKIKSSLSCTNQTGTNCTFSYGNEPKWFGNENWSRILRFEYDFNSKEIDEFSLQCIDIP